MILSRDALLNTTLWQNAHFLEEPLTTSPRPLYKSKLAVGVIMATLGFVILHVVLLLRVLTKVHGLDPRVLWLPVYSLSASCLVAVFAFGIHKMT